jgi:hypothetical protein
LMLQLKEKGIKTHYFLLKMQRNAIDLQTDNNVFYKKD